MLLLMVLGCTDYHSSDLYETQAFNPSFEATFDGDDIDASATLSMDERIDDEGLDFTADYAVLAADDTLAVSWSDHETQLQSAGGLSEHVYVGAIKDAAPASGALIRFSFERPDERAVRGSYCRLPNNFVITEPQGDRFLNRDKYSRSDDDVVVRWETSGESDYSVEVFLLSSCGDYARGEAQEDDGVWVFEAGDYSNEVSNRSDSCSATVQVRQIRPGVIAAPFGYGDIQCTQERQVEFTLTE